MISLVSRFDIGMASFVAPAPFVKFDCDVVDIDSLLGVNRELQTPADSRHCPSRQAGFSIARRGVAAAPFAEIDAGCRSLFFVARYATFGSRSVGRAHQT